MGLWILRFVSDKKTDTPAMRKDKAMYQLGRIADGRHMAKIVPAKKGNKIIYKLYTKRIDVLGGKG